MSYHVLQPWARGIFWGGWSAGDSRCMGAVGASQEGVSPSSWKQAVFWQCKAKVSISVRAASLKLSEEGSHACLCLPPVISMSITSTFRKERNPPNCLGGLKA